MPVQLSSSHPDIYIARSLTTSVDQLGYKPVMPPINAQEVRHLRQELEKGNHKALDFKKNLIYSCSDILIYNPTFIPDFNDINNELIEYLAKKPDLLHELHWRKFEELLSVLFKAKGYDTTLGPGSGDGGVDIRMISKTGITGSLMTLVQAKKYAVKNKISLQPVQALYGVLKSEKASKGLFVTTSTYEPCARRFAESNAHRLQLADKNDLRSWLKEHQG
jgi:hypothetical protein